MDKELFGYLSIIISLIQYVPYCWAIHQGQMRPHAFSRLIWGTISAIVFLAQIKDKGGAGAWATGTTMVGSFVAMALALRQGKQDITRGDCIALILALSAVPLWVLTKTPLPAVLLVTLIDGAGYFPTFRKAMHKPHEESAYAFSIGGIKNFFGIVALEHYSAITLIYPLFLVVADTFLIMFLLMRRKKILV